MKNKIIIILSISLGIMLWLYFAQEEIVSDTSRTVVEIKQETSSIVDTRPKSIELVTLKVPIKVPSESKTDTVEKIIYKDKEVKKYTYNDSLPNGILTSTILSDHIYTRNIELTTFSKETTTTNEKIFVKSQLYFGSMMTLDLDKSISNVSLNAFYTHKGQWLITTGLGYDLKHQNPTATIGVAFKF